MFVFCSLAGGTPPKMKVGKGCEWCEGFSERQKTEHNLSFQGSPVRVLDVDWSGRSALTSGEDQAKIVASFSHPFTFLFGDSPLKMANPE